MPHPQPAATFLASLGVCTAVSRRHEDLAHTIDCLRYLGLRWVRQSYESDVPVADLLELARQTGVRFAYGPASGGNDLDRLLRGGRELAAAGALLAFEGNNEPNNWGVTYQGESGGREASWLPVARLQRDLYARVKADPLLRDYPVWSLSEGGAETDNVGLQYLTIPPGAGCAMPDGTRYADFANCHNYLSHPEHPGLYDNQAWIASDPGPACRVDGLYGNYGRTWRAGFPGYGEEELATLPRVTTETGVLIDGPFTERVQGLLYLSLYLAQFARGWQHTSVYLLRDRSDEEGNQTFGFYAPDYTPRLAAHYLHNLTTVLADPDPHAWPDSVDCRLLDPPETVHDLLLQKGDGTVCLVVWGERFGGDEDVVTLELGRRATALRVYDPTVGTEPVRELVDAERVELTLSDHPLVLCWRPT
ncbi:MAG: glycosyl hydrolase [Armatimonadetes bacterium]|nr:glycosyl hydrolase [Armatimonadota bacterium]